MVDDALLIVRPGRLVGRLAAAGVVLLLACATSAVLSPPQLLGDRALAVRVTAVVAVLVVAPLLALADGPPTSLDVDAVRWLPGVALVEGLVTLLVLAAVQAGAGLLFAGQVDVAGIRTVSGLLGLGWLLTGAVGSQVALTGLVAYSSFVLFSGLAAADPAVWWAFPVAPVAAVLPTVTAAVLVLAGLARLSAAPAG